MPDPAAARDAESERARAAAIGAVQRLPDPSPGLVPNFGDLTRFKEWPDAAVDLLVGGTPCQSFSVAGLRKGLDDPRGNLALTYLAVADRYRPSWVVWENVPGVLSSNKGRDFGAFLGGLAKLGYGWAYRVLDAQFVRTRGLPRAVPQRRRRVFVVGYLGDWRPAAAVLFDRQSMRGDPPPRREAGQGPSPTLSARTRGGGGLGTDFEVDGGLIPEISNALAARDHKMPRAEGNVGIIPVPAHPVTGPLSANGGTTNKHGFGMGQQDWESGYAVPVAHALRGEGFDASEDGTGRGTPLVPMEAVAFNARQDPDVYIGRSGPLDTDGSTQAVAFDLRGREDGAVPEGPHHTANIRAASGGSSRSYVAQPWAVRRLTPRECERLQGFPDDYTLVRYRGRPAADGPRYKALGNSMAVNVMQWIGERIAFVEGILEEVSGQ